MSMEKTIGEMLSEMENSLEEARRIKAEVEKFKFIFDHSPEEKKRELLEVFLKNH